MTTSLLQHGIVTGDQFNYREEVTNFYNLAAKSTSNFRRKLEKDKETLRKKVLK